MKIEVWHALCRWKCDFKGNLIDRERHRCLNPIRVKERDNFEAVMSVQNRSPILKTPKTSFDAVCISFQKWNKNKTLHNNSLASLDFNISFRLGQKWDNECFFCLYIKTPTSAFCSTVRSEKRVLAHVPRPALGSAPGPLLPRYSRPWRSSSSCA